MKKYGFTILNVKVLFLILGALVLATPANAKRKKMPKIDLKTDMIHDSICREGFLLYCYEKVAWVGTDMFFAHAKDKQNEIAGVFTRRVDDKFFNVFYDKNGNCIFEYIIDENGIDVEAVKRKAIERGTITEEQAAKAREIKKTVAEEKAANLPEQMIQNIAAGMVNKFFKENCLLNQEYNRDPKLNMAQYMDQQSKGLTVTSYKRFTLNAE